MEPNTKTTVRAKFRVDSITETSYGKSIKLFPVSSGSDENKSFFKATPSGSIEIGTVNPDAAAAFKISGEYYIDFTPA